MLPLTHLPNRRRNLLNSQIHKFKFSFLDTVFSFLFTFFIQASTLYGQTPFQPCTGCVANDDHVESVVLVQLNPDYTPVSGKPQFIDLPTTCSGSTTITGYLKITFTQNATTRYGISLAGNILVDGVFSQTFTYCDPAETNSGTFVKYISDFPITYTCGTKLELQDLFIGWGNSAGSNVCPAPNSPIICAASPHCEQLPLTPGGPPIVIVTPLSADFTATGSCAIAKPAQTYSFDALDATDGTTGGTLPYSSFSWTIVNKNTSLQVGTMTGSNPSFDFAQAGAGPGVYTVTLTVTDGASPAVTSTISKDITVISCCPPLDAGTDGTLSVCTGTTPTQAQLFAALGGTPSTGGTWSGPVTGVYTYTVTAAAPCSNTATSTVTVTEAAKPNAGTSGALSICTGSTVTEAQLYAVIGTHDAGGTWSPALAGAGTYTYTVAATAPCTEDATSTVTVTEAAKPNAGTSGALSICTGSTVTEAQLYAVIGTHDAGGTWSPALAGAGTYTYTVAATAPCTEDATSTVTVTEAAKPNAGTSGALSICTGSTVTEAQLYAVIGTHDAGGTWSPALAGAGTYTYTVAATAPCTEDATSTVTVTEAAKPNAGTSGALSICTGSTVTEAQLYAVIGTHDAGGTWSPALAGAGTYTYTVAATAPCTEDATSTVTVTEAAKPNAGTSGALSICTGSTVTEAQLYAVIGTHDAGGTWSPALAGAGTYTYTVAATAPCTEDATSTVTVTEAAKPNAGTSGALSICTGSTVTEAQLYAVIGTHDAGGTWSPALAGAGTYTYTVAATAPCTEDATSTVTVTEAAKPNAGTSGALSICTGSTVTEAQLYAVIGTHDAGGTWSPALAGAGTYTYTVAATAPCTEDATSTVTVTEAAKPNAGTSGALSICTGSTVTEAQLYAVIGTHDAGGTWSPALAGAGTYTYTVAATAPCTEDATSTVTVTEAAKPNAGTSGALSICTGSTVTEAQLYAVIGTHDAGGTWSPALAGAGTYTYTVAATAPCTEDATSTVTVTEAAKPNAGTSGALSICTGSTVTEAQLYAVIGTHDAGGTWSPALAGAGTYTYTVAATAPCTEDATSTVTVTEAAKPNAGTSGALSICTGSTVTEAQLYAVIGTHDAGGTWSPALAGAGTYTYTVAATAPCTEDATSTVTVTEAAKPNAGTSGALSICTGSTVTEAQLYAVIGTHDAGGTWSPALAGAGTYTYTVAATAPCTEDATSTVTVTEAAKPNAGTSGALSICTGSTVTEAQLYAVIGTHDAGGTWSPALAGAGTYTYTVAATAPCTEDATSTVTVTEAAKPNAGTSGALSICTGSTVTEAQLYAVIGTHDAGGTWSPALAGAGTYTYTVAATAPCTEDATSTVTVTEAAKPNAGTSGALSICTGSTVTEAQLYAVIGTHDAGGTWSPALAGAGTYTYTVAATAPCTEDATSTVTVTEAAKPNAGTSGALSICTGSTVTEAQLYAVIGTHDAGGTWSPALAGAGTYILYRCSDNTMYRRCNINCYGYRAGTSCTNIVNNPTNLFRNCDRQQSQ